MIIFGQGIFLELEENNKNSFHMHHTKRNLFHISNVFYYYSLQISRFPVTDIDPSKFLQSMQNIKLTFIESRRMYVFDYTSYLTIVTKCNSFKLIIT